MSAISRNRFVGGLRADLAPLLLVGALVAAAAATAAAGPERLRALTTRSLQQTVAAGSFDDRSLTVEAQVLPGTGGGFQAVADLIGEYLDPVLLTTFPVTGHTYLARSVPAAGPTIPEPGGLPAALTLLADDRTARNVVYRQGTAPDAPGAAVPAGAIGVAVSTQTSRALGLAPGATFRLGTPADPVTAVVTGVFDRAPRGSLAPDDNAFLAGAQGLFTPVRDAIGDRDPIPYWTAYVVVGDAGLERLLAAGADAGAVPAPGADLGGANPDAAGADLSVHAVWRRTADPATFDAGSISTLRKALVALPRTADHVCDVVALPYGKTPTCGSLTVIPATVRTSEHLTPLLDRFTGARLSAAVLESFGVAGLLAVELAAVLAAARLVALRKAAAIALERARGASRRQLFALACGESGLVIGPAALAGWLAGALLGGSGPGTGPGTVGATGGDGAGGVAWWPVLVIAAVGVAAVPALGLWLGAPARAGRAEGGGRFLTPGRRRTVEAAVLALAVGGVLALRARGTAGTAAAGSIDPQIALVPVLVGAVGVVVVIRVLPRPVAGAARLVSRTRGTAAWIGTARAAERGQTAAIALGVLVVTLSGAVFGGVVQRTLATGQQAAAARIGADAVVSAPDLPPAALAALRKAPGVESVSGELAVPRMAIDEADGTGRLVLLIGVEPGLLPGMPPAVATPAQPSAADAPIPVLASASLRRAIPDGAFTADLNSRTREFAVAAVHPGPAGEQGVPAVLRPAFQDYTLPWAVVPLAELSALAGDRPPTTAVLTGPRITSAGLRAALLGTASAGTDITVRTETLDRLRADGLARSLTALFEVCSALSAAFTVLIIVLDLTAGARERGRTVAVLRTLGLPSRSAAVLTAVQLLPVLLAATGAGLALGVVLPRLLGPALDLTAFTDGYAPPIRTDVGLTLVLAAALIGVGVLAALIEVVVGRRRRMGEVLRLGTG